MAFGAIIIWFATHERSGGDARTVWLVSAEIFFENNSLDYILYDVCFCVDLSRNAESGGP